MKRLFSMAALLALAACATGDGQRCNPLLVTSDCDTGLTCVYPTAPNCGVAYCCALDANGNIADKNPNCQLDPSLAPACGLDLGGTD